MDFKLVKTNENEEVKTYFRALVSEYSDDNEDYDNDDYEDEDYEDEDYENDYLTSLPLKPVINLKEKEIKTLEIDPIKEPINEIKIFKKKEEDNKMNLSKIFGISKLGKVTDSRFKLSPYGIAIRNDQGQYVAYDQENDKLIDVMDITFSTNGFLYALPAKEVKKGDLILRGNEPLYIQEVAENDELIVLNAITEKVETYKTKKNAFGFQSFVVITSFINVNAQEGEINPLMFAVLTGEEGTGKDLLPFLMMQQGPGNDINPMMLIAMMGDNKGSDLLPLLMMQQGNNNNNNNSMLPFLLMKDGDMKDILPFLMMSGVNPFNA